MEGPSDDTALGVILEKLFSSSTVHVEITYGDITSDYDYDSTKIVQKVAELIGKYAQNNHFTKYHFQQIIHLIDTDGANVPDSSVIEDTSISNIVYSETCIRTPRKEDIVKRNNHKKDSINNLIRCDKIWGVP